MTMYAVTLFFLTYALWIFFLAVMSLKRAHDADKLSPVAYALAVPVLAVGYALDVLINMVVMTAVLFELPREMTVTARLKRHHSESTGWRLYVVLFIEPILDPFDPSGDHI